MNTLGVVDCINGPTAYYIHIFTWWHYRLFCQKVEATSPCLKSELTIILFSEWQWLLRLSGLCSTIVCRVYVCGNGCNGKMEKWFIQLKFFDPHVSGPKWAV